MSTNTLLFGFFLKFRSLLVAGFLLLAHFTSNAQTSGLIINEISNGAAGTQEYYELLVVGPACATVDLRNWMIDDNNGDFTGGPGSGLGIASGHVRFKYITQWQFIPTGSLILVYNSSDKNTAITLADDPTDSNQDSVYVLPASHTSLESGGGIPSTATANYIPNTYSNTGWNSLGLANGGDAAQTRSPDGSYFHGICYGPIATFSGGPDNLNINTTSSAGGKCFYFTALTNNYRAANNFTTGSVAGGNESPGAPNNPGNQAYINAMRCPESLPVSLLNFTAVYSPSTTSVQLDWTIAAAGATHYFIIERSTNQITFDSIGSLLFIPNNFQYQYRDEEVTSGSVCYRLKQIDEDGLVTYTNAKCLETLSSELLIYPVPASEYLHIHTSASFSSDELQYSIYKVTGELQEQGATLVYEGETSINISLLIPGCYYITIISPNSVPVKRLFIVE